MGCTGRSLWAQDSTPAATILIYQNKAYVKAGGGITGWNLWVKDGQGNRQVWRSSAEPMLQLGLQKDYRAWYWAYSLDVSQLSVGYTAAGVEHELFLSGIQLGLVAGWSPRAGSSPQGLEFRPRLGGGIYSFAMGTAELTENLQTTDLIKTEAIQPLDLAAGIHLGLTAQDHRSGLGMWVELGYRMGLTNLAIASLQSANLGGSTVLVGLRYELFRKLGNP
jgi:hypothetical protein